MISILRNPLAARALRAASLFLLSAAPGCVDIQQDSPLTPTAGLIPEGAILLPPEEAYHILPSLASPKDAHVIEGEFLYIVPDGKIYIEENNENNYRISRIVCGNDTLVYAQQAHRAGSGQPKIFYRHMAIGYSYNGLEGDYANPTDLRCQIINRAEIDRLSAGSLLIYNRFANVIRHSSQRYSSLADYVHATTFHAHGGVGIQTLGAKVAATYGAFEEGVATSLILTDKTNIDCAEYYLQWTDLQDWISRYPSILTYSFRKACENISDPSSIDNFIKMYGTHVVTYAMLGASLEIEVQLETTRFVDTYHKDFESDLLLMLFNQHTSASVTEKDYQIVENSHCRLKALGGDPGMLGKALNLTTYSNNGLSGKMVNDWIGSVKMDDDNLPESNARLVEFEMVPIWEFIPDEQKSDLVKARIISNAENLAATYGRNNFIDASFDIDAPQSGFYHGTFEKRMDNAPTKLVIACNRYVALVCEEPVPEIDLEKPVRVAYPIYEGRPDITDGFCIHDGKAYSVGWIEDRFVVVPEGEASSSRVWLSKGKLSATEYSNISYTECSSHPDVIFPQDLRPDGSINDNEGFCIVKVFGNFYLVGSDGNTPSENLIGLPGWEYCRKDPTVANGYPDFRWEWANSTFKLSSLVPGWRRDSDYIYYYMPSIIHPK